MFQRNIWPSFSGSKSKLIKKPAQFAACWFLVWLTFQPWRWRQHVPPKYQAFSRLHSITTQTTVMLCSHFCGILKSDGRWKVIAAPWFYEKWWWKYFSSHKVSPYYTARFLYFVQSHPRLHCPLQNVGLPKPPPETVSQNVTFQCLLKW
jgi:hypothetical protein